MFTPSDNCITWRGITVPRWPARGCWVYLYHFSEPDKHAAHYLGSTCNLNIRDFLHKKGHAARLTQVVIESGRSLELVRLWPCESLEAARLLEKRLKHAHGHGPALCPYCSGKPMDAYAAMRLGHYPLRQYVGRRQPTPRYQNVPFERR